jgi:hypothetical protein
MPSSDLNLETRQELTASGNQIRLSFPGFSTIANTVTFKTINGLGLLGATNLKTASISVGSESVSLLKEVGDVDIIRSKNINGIPLLTINSTADLSIKTAKINFQEVVGPSAPDNFKVVTYDGNEPLKLKFGTADTVVNNNEILFVYGDI